MGLADSLVRKRPSILQYEFEKVTSGVSASPARFSLLPLGTPLGLSMGLWLFACPVACWVSILPLCPPPSNVMVSVQIQEDSIPGPSLLALLGKRHRLLLGWPS